LWLGALARLDFLSGEDKYLTVIVPKDVTIHRTPITRASEVFVNQAGRILLPTYHPMDEDQASEFLNSMVKHEINLQCDTYKEANFDVVIQGLGWISV
jgi:hypothetical protein